VYSFMLLLYFALGISETRRGERSPVSLKTVVLQCAEVLSRKVNGVRLPVRYVFAVSCAIGVFMTYLTNSSFIFIEYFGVSETVFPVFFGINVVGMMAANVYSMRRLTAANAPRVFSLGMRVQIAAVSVLVSLVIVDLASLATLTPVMVVIVSTLGLIGPSGSSQYMSHFQKLAGSASSIYTTTLFSTGAVLGGISGYFFDGTLRPMVLTMLAATIIANLLAWSIRRARRTDVPPQRE
jgi:DHA1 family bicyclomycin/chloramphenicol resistance-like MFS transporter